MNSPVRMSSSSTPDATNIAEPKAPSSSRLLLAASLLGVEKRGVGPGREPVERVIRFESSQAHADPNANVGLDRSIYHIEAAGDNIIVDAAKSTYELVAAIANDWVEGAQVRSQGQDEYLQHVIASGVPIPVVDALQSIDVNEDNDEAPVGPPCAVELMVEREPAYLATEGSGKVVKVSAQQLRLQAGALAGGTGLILCGPVSTGCGTSAGR